jgi:hypothetical protein
MGGGLLVISRRETQFFQGRDKDPETAPAIQWADCRDKMRARIPASSGAIRSDPGNLYLRKNGWEDSNF